MTPTPSEIQLLQAIGEALELLKFDSFIIGPQGELIPEPIEESSVANTIEANRQYLPAEEAALLAGDCSCIRSAVYILAKAKRDAHLRGL